MAHLEHFVLTKYSIQFHKLASHKYWNSTPIETLVNDKRDLTPHHHANLFLLVQVSGFHMLSVSAFMTRSLHRKLFSKHLPKAEFMILPLSSLPRLPHSCSDEHVE